MKGKMKCPICHGKGKITENAEEYMFETRDPETNTCLICMGTGLVGARKVLPDGTPAREVRASSESPAVRAGCESAARSEKVKPFREERPAPEPEVQCPGNDEFRAFVQKAMELVPPQDVVIIKATYVEIIGTTAAASTAVGNIISKIKNGE